MPSVIQGVRYAEGLKGPHMLKKVILIAGIAGALGLAIGPASADPSACVDVYLQVNDTVVAQSQCVPPPAE